MKQSEILFERAGKVIPGGVNSPVRAFRSVGLTPPFIRQASGATVTDEDGRTYLDYVGSWGPMLLGHARPEVIAAICEAAPLGTSFGAPTRMEVELAELLVRLVPSMDMVRMVSSGTEAVMSAIRVARGFTGRRKVMKFNGCYHGHSDSMLVRSGSGLLTTGVPDSAGVPEGASRDTLTAEFNDKASVESLFAANPGEVAAVIVEPLPGNMGVLPPDEGFLAFLRDITQHHGALLIFDEVISGFRLSLAGAQGYFGITPDLTTLGKIIGGGMPVGAYGGRREIMECVSPLGPVYQAGTLSGNPVAMAAGLTMLRLIEADTTLYTRLGHYAETLCGAIAEAAGHTGIPVCVNRVGGIFSFFFTGATVRDCASAKTSDTSRFSAFFRAMLEQGIYLPPSQFEAWFLSAAHSEEDIQRTCKAIRSAFEEISKNA